ncbi:MFS transporter [Actinocorallia populi]|uniref:MFS transporter n=1 Tax=Actinocorallia populi TaxID=2079200 RepID=UPI001E434095|nr:MFS transporter [Actinocorallia populi]
MSSPSPRTARSGPIVAVLAGAGITVSLMQTLIVPLIGELPVLLDTNATDASWTLTSTLLAGAVATPVFGRLGDLYGKRRLMLACTALLTLGSLICALSSTLIPVVAGRTLQGFGLPLVSLGISVMRDVLPPERLGSAMALMSSSLGVGGAMGLPLAAAIAQKTDWHALFWLSSAGGVVIGVLLLAVVPESSVRARSRFDLPGTVGLTIGLVCLLLAVTKGQDWGWSSGTVLGLLVAALIVFLVWGRWELRTPAPLVDLRVSAGRQILVTNLASVLIGFSMYAMSLVVIQVLQLPESTGYGMGQSMIQAGLWMAPGGLVMMAVSPFAARLVAARGAKTALTLGALVISLGYTLAAFLMEAPWQMLLFTMLISAGIGLSYASMPALIMSAVPLTETAAANGLNSLARSIGTSASAAVVGVVLAHMTVPFGPVPIPSEAGFRTGLAIGAGSALLAALVALALPRHRPPLPTPAEPPVKAAA